MTPSAASAAVRAAVRGEVLSGSGWPLVITSGTDLARSNSGGPAVETDDHVTSAESPRAASEEAADALIAKGARVMVMRFPQVPGVAERERDERRPALPSARRNVHAARWKAIANDP